MTLYLQLDNKGVLRILGDKPGAPFTEYRQPWFFGARFGVWHDRFPRINDALVRILTLGGCADYIKAAQQAALQLSQMYSNEGTLFVALGASPKIIKWSLKAYGFPVVTINASGMSDLSINEPATADFNAYVTRKLQKHAGGIPARVILLDFADTGKSLLIMRNVITAIDGFAHVQVVMVATGTGTNFGKDKDGAAPPLGWQEIVKLQGYGMDIHLKPALSFELLKNEWLGRHKAKNNFQNWSAQQSQVLEPGTMPARGGPGMQGARHFAGMTQSTHYQNQKDFVRLVMNTASRAPVLAEEGDEPDDDMDEALSAEAAKAGGKPYLRSKTFKIDDFAEGEGLGD